MATQTTPTLRPVSISSKFDFLDVGGSVNEGLPGRSIAINEWQFLRNLYQLGSRLIRRKGVTWETEVGPQLLTGVFVLNAEDGRTLLALGIDTIYRQDGTDLIELPRVEGGVFPSTTLPWVAVQYSNMAYLMRDDNIGLRRAGSDFVQQAGIETMTAPVIADGGAGVMTAGDYTVVATGYNTQTNNESNPSDPSNTLTLGASKKISGTIGVHPNPQVDAIRLYVSVPDQSGRWFFAGQITNGEATFEINLAIQDYGDDVSFSNGLPPPRLKVGDSWRERLIASDGIDVFLSQPGKFEAWDPFDVIPVARNDGHDITTIHAISDAAGDRVMIGKTNKVHYLLSSGGAFALRTLTHKHGCWSHHSMKSAEGSLFWYGGDNIYRSDAGGAPYSITTLKLRNLLKQIPKSRREYVTGFIFPELSWYGLTISIDADAETNRYLLIYNYKTDVWTVFDYFPLPTSIGPAFVLSDFDESDEPALYAVFYNNRVAKLESGTDDDGEPYRCEALGPDHDFGATGLVKFLRAIHLLISQRPSFTLPDQDVFIGARLDGGPSLEDGVFGVDATRQINLDTARPWKRFNLSTLGQPATTIAPYFFYQGFEHLELDAYAMEVIVQARYPRSG